ncbi:MAG: UvrB/UvrC motif-containing protein [Planctomycetes bacterium]|nr:UvrB/UvrC motif-containing protein [Planctomycetota bacterium]
MEPPSPFALLPHCLDRSSPSSESVDRPRDDTTKSFLKPIASSAGVFLLTDEANRPILLAHAQNIRRAVEHRLTPPDPDEKTKRADLASITRRIHWVETFSPIETLWIHYRMAKALFPKTYREQIGFGAVWYIRIEPKAAFPRFTAVDRLKDDNATYIGPLAASRDAEAWIAMLEDAFDLCRYFNVLEKAPHGERCAYYDMGKCPAPCDGTISMADYHAMIESALAFTLGRSQARLDALRDQMQRAAAALEFEKAATIRRTIERAESTLGGSEYRLMTPTSRCNWLVIQVASRPSRIASKQRIRPFYVCHGVIEAGEPAAMADAPIDAWIEELRHRVQSPGATHAADATARGNALALVSRFLFQESKAAGLFLRADALPTSEHLGVMIQSKFTPPVRRPVDG